jgi:hypothetical protein
MILFQIKRSLSFFLLLLSLSVAGCTNDEDVLSLTVLESAEIKSVKNGSLELCPSATVGEMADAFLSNPSWRDFESTGSGKVVELTGGLSYDDSPATALIQFTFDGGNFETAYLGINGQDQNLIVLSALLQKMCEATLY